MFAKRIKLDPQLYARARRHAALAGYSSIEEFVAHAIEKELARLEQSDSEDEIRKKLKGLGYLA
jgi:hypothetical protein